MAKFQDLPAKNKSQPVSNTGTGPLSPSSNKPLNIIEEGGSITFNKNKKQESKQLSEQPIQSVKKMQQLLINVASNISNHQIHDVEHRVDEHGNALAGSDPFMNFLVSNYINKAKPLGKQLINTDVNMPTRMDTSKYNDNLKGILQSIKRIGTPGVEQSPDGIWGPRTNNALKQIYALAYMMVSLIKDMELSINNYSEADLANFHNDIPEDQSKLNLNQQNKAAEVLINDLNKFINMYNEFREIIFTNPKYSSLISQEKPLMIDTGKPKQSNELNLQEQELYNQLKAVQVNAMINGQKVAITPYDLSSMSNFKKFLLRNNNLEAFQLSEEEKSAFEKNDTNLLNKLVGQVLSGLEVLQGTR